MAITTWTAPTATPSQAVEKILFTAGAITDINAPAEVVFDVITGFSKYHNWNTWTPSLKFDESDADVKAGAKGNLHVWMEAQNREFDVPIVVGTSEATGSLSSFFKSIEPRDSLEL